MKYARLLAVLGAAAVVLVPQATARQHASAHGTRPEAAELSRLLGGIVERRDETWRWQRLMLKRRTPYSGSAARILSLQYRKWVYRLWDDRATKAKARALDPPHRAEWMCIHRYEAPWSDPNAPYYGGLQMDVQFQSEYAPELLRAKGTADHWTPLEQMWVAERAYRERGYWPWPHTARYCGLL